MSLFIEVIDWTESEEGVIAWRFPTAGNSIKDGAQLTVRDTQLALFVEQGKPADVFGSGQHTLDTDNLPILGKLQSWPFGFEEPFKSEIYFFSLRPQQGQRWGTPAPITLRDKEFGALQIRMFGNFSWRIADVPIFFARVCGARPRVLREELSEQLIGLIAGKVASAFAQSGVAFIDMAANQAELAAAVRSALQEDAAMMGLAIESFVIENISLPQALQEALNERMSAGIRGGK